jgi:hypothetical protein
MQIYLAFPAAQGCAAEIDDGKSLISKPGENHIFAAASAEKARMALFGVSIRGAESTRLISGTRDAGACPSSEVS